MQDNIHTLNAILESVFKEKNHKIKKRLIYNKSALGGMDSKWLILSFILLPFALYAAIFNPAIFESLGIAQAIVLYIIMLVFAMQVVIGVAYYNNKSVVKIASESWNEYFPTVDFKTILSSGVTPYVDFVKHYESALAQGKKDEALHTELSKSFSQMQNDNRDLYEAMTRDNKKDK
jgi:cytochrome c oxidase subunit IV